MYNYINYNYLLVGCYSKDGTGKVVVSLWNLSYEITMIIGDIVERNLR